MNMSNIFLFLARTLNANSDFMGFQTIFRRLKRRQKPKMKRVKYGNYKEVRNLYIDKLTLNAED